MHRKAEAAAGHRREVCRWAVFRETCPGELVMSYTLWITRWKEGKPAVRSRAEDGMPTSHCLKKLPSFSFQVWRTALMQRAGLSDVASALCRHHCRSLWSCPVPSMM